MLNPHLVGDHKSDKTVLFTVIVDLEIVTSIIDRKKVQELTRNMDHV